MKLSEYKNYAQSSKKELAAGAKEYAANLLEAVGEDPLKVLKFAKALKVVADEIENEVKPFTQEAFAAWAAGGKEVNAFGAKFTYVEGSKPMLDYMQDMVCQSLDIQLKQRKQLIDLAFDRWHKNNQHLETVDPDTGEKIPIVKVKGGRASYVKCEF